MNKSNVLTKTQQYFVVILAVVLSLLVVWSAVSGATTISSNISTGGTLTVTGVSTLTGLATMNGGISAASSTIHGKLSLTGGLNASSTATSTYSNGIRLYGGCFTLVDGTCLGATSTTSSVNTFTGEQNFTVGFVSSGASSTVASTLAVGGQLQASTTLIVNSLSTFTGGFISSASSTVAGAFKVSSVLNASSTLTVAGISYFDSLANLTGGFISGASSTAISYLNVTGQLNASTTLSVTGTAQFFNSLTTATSTATTTLALQADSNGVANQNEGACLQLRGTNGNVYRMYIGTADNEILNATTSARGSGSFFAIWEPGTCQ
ncbi:MAG: hypothetical protein A3I89_01880 [Candidatus Harrisonbacteria bacterium RIFCSPLOWO2_02_FULL_41_11]|uniref:Uncharacterized protein n=1 Tax=Candidatus Harrisonbacteria bacterium RIFCSPHIGHO2_02_FULL_42_16 TaxID=1798404 RepID=A0A1G1ZFI6_9BACT|nr:MAG: hypothetical protein A3B92_01930 [Candidatus Harrisonbacteria bacterium RIFCSPHIGHO2_02_FULL_42_16]OGY65614.1 MAG: hypothetical protein A3I89_01880 [Candidatus Harrisonbacteria bacterium RIFCSPLOWO2_02_FULL_41_11]